MKKALAFLLVTFVLFVVIVPKQFSSPAAPPAGNEQHALAGPASTQATRIPDSKSWDPGLNDALQKAVAAHREQVVAFALYDVSIQSVRFSQDGTWAILWLALVDRSDSSVLIGEPGLAIAQRAGGAKDASWTITLQEDADWGQMLARVPAGLLTAEERALFDPSQAKAIKLAGPLSGYLLPWARGQSKVLTGSIGHALTYKSCPNDCLYAFDFADGTQFPVLAARGGTVKYAAWTCPDGVETCVNYLVLEDRTTNPVTYQLYMHFAQDSIPPELRVVGTPVLQGQFIGKADDTGYSTGNHLHFMVHTNPNSYWGSSVDITFDDVAVNGGRPRTQSEAQAFPQYGSQWTGSNRYVSWNVNEANPPTGEITQPADGSVITSNTLSVSGWASDDQKLDHAELRVDTGNGWKPVGDKISASPFSVNVDLCAAGIPAGNFRLGIQAWDQVGNPSNVLSVHTLNNRAPCAQPPVSCQPTADQIALFTGVDYSGSCAVYGSGDVPVISGPVSASQAQSVRVGANVRVILYAGTGFSGRVETLERSVANLAGEASWPALPSSLRVQSRLVPPQVPTLFAPTSQTGGTPSDQDSLVLNWQGEGATSYRVQLYGPGGLLRTRDWGPRAYWSLGSLPAGNYRWTVQAANSAGQSQAQGQFTVVQAGAPGGQNVRLPYDETFNSGTGAWQGTGLWRYAAGLGTNPNASGWVFNRADTGQYGGTSLRSGDLTSPPFSIPCPCYFLQFSYYYQTESSQPYHDLRLLQISLDGGPFQDLWQLQDDPMNTWLQSPEISLSPFSGHTARLRFHFDALDDVANNGFGWAIGQVHIALNSQGQSCPATDVGNDPAQAARLQIGASVDEAIWPSGDTDWYTFNATAGQWIWARVDAASQNSPLVPDLILFDSDGQSVLQTGQPQPGGNADPYLRYQVQRDGVYYLEVKSKDHPSSGGSAYKYTLRLGEGG